VKSFLTLQDDHHHFLTVSKSRKNLIVHDSNVVVEICLLRADVGVSREWLSVAVESESASSVLEFVAATPSLWEAVALCPKLLERGCSPVLSGYPLWVRVVSGSLASTDSEWDRLVDQPLQSFLSFISSPIKKI
jgi:hypothetical protein